MGICGARWRITLHRPWGDDPNQACATPNIYDETARKPNRLPWANYPCEDGQGMVAPVGKYAPNKFLACTTCWATLPNDLFRHTTARYAGGETRCADPNAVVGGRRRVARGVRGPSFRNCSTVRLPVSHACGKPEV